MKLKKFEEMNEGLEDKETKRILHQLRTELNIYKKCLGSIEYSIEHKKTGPYDYGESSDNVLSNIKSEIADCKSQVNRIKNK